MANPGKTYNLPCSLMFPFGGVLDKVILQDIIKIGRREFQVNLTIIEVGEDGDGET